MRIDRDANDYVYSQELLNYLKENIEHTVIVAECMDLINYFDCDEDGRLSFKE